MKKVLSFLSALALVSLCWSLAEAQQPVKLCVPTSSTNCITVDATHPLPITSGGGGGGTDVNLISVNGDALSLGATSAANGIPIALPTDQSLAISGTVTASGTVDATTADCENVVMGCKADAKSTATDSTPITEMQVLKQISASVQAPPSQAVTVIDGGDVTLGSKADAKSTATDTTAVTIMQVLKEISAMVQAPPSQAVTNAGTFAVQSAPSPATSGGLSICYLQATASTNATNCKASAGQVYHVRVTNNSTNIAYLRLYNLSSAPTCSSATGFVDSYIIPAPAVGGGGIVDEITMGVAYGTGIGFCFTGAIGTTDTTNVAASAYQIAIYYK